MEIGLSQMQAWQLELMPTHLELLFTNSFWTLDLLGVTNGEMLERDLELEVKNTIKHNETDRFVVSWPWKNEASSNGEKDDTRRVCGI